MKGRYKITLINTGLAFLFLFVFSLIPKQPWQFRDYAAALGLITPVGAAIDLVVGLILLLFRKKETAIGFLLSTVALLLLFLLCILVVKNK